MSRMILRTRSASAKAAKPAKLLVADRAKGANANGEMAKALVRTGRRIGQRPSHRHRGFLQPRGYHAGRAHALLAEKHGDNATSLRAGCGQSTRTARWTAGRLHSPLMHPRGRPGWRPDFVVRHPNPGSGGQPRLRHARHRMCESRRLAPAVRTTQPHGAAHRGEAAVLVRADQTEKSDDDPVYDAALAATWKWLKEHAGEYGHLRIRRLGLVPRLDGADLPTLNAPTGHVRVMLPAHVDALVQTAPEPWPTPEVALFLHGPKSSAADVQVCWRAGSHR